MDELIPIILRPEVTKTDPQEGELRDHFHIIAGIGEVGTELFVAFPLGGDGVPRFLQKFQQFFAAAFKVDRVEGTAMGEDGQMHGLTILVYGVESLIIREDAQWRIKLDAFEVPLLHAPFDDVEDAFTPGIDMDKWDDLRMLEADLVQIGQLIDVCPGYFPGSHIGHVHGQDDEPGALGIEGQTFFQNFLLGTEPAGGDEFDVTVEDVVVGPEN